jgi:2-methylisocitrate lyase-like PEP mutase family enzyme
VSLRSLVQGPLPVTAPLALNPLMAEMVEGAGFPAGYLGGGATKREGAPDWVPTEEAMLSAIDLEKLLAVERVTVEKGQT